MSITWFRQATRGRGARVDNKLRITFTSKPKGLRLNTTLTMHIQNKGYDYVQIGVTENELVLKPSKTKEQSFKLTVNKKSAQICATSIGNWAQENGFMGAKIVGEYNEQDGIYTFPLSAAEVPKKKQQSQ